MRQTDIVLTGLAASEYFEKYVGKLLSLLRDATNEYDVSAADVDELEKLVLEMRTSSTPEQRLRVVSVIDSLHASMARVKEVLDVTYPAAWRQLQWRIMFYKYIVKTNDIVDNLSVKLRDAKEDLKKRSHQLGDRLGMLSEKLVQEGAHQDSEEIISSNSESSSPRSQ